MATCPRIQHTLLNEYELSTLALGPRLLHRAIRYTIDTAPQANSRELHATQTTTTSSQLITTTTTNY